MLQRWHMPSSLAWENSKMKTQKTQNCIHDCKYRRVLKLRKNSYSTMKPPEPTDVKVNPSLAEVVADPVSRI